MSAFDPKRTSGRYIAVGRQLADLPTTGLSSVPFSKVSGSWSLSAFFRGAAVQLAAILPWREMEPASARAKKAALVGEAEQMSGI
jgi:hypothetical protein